MKGLIFTYLLTYGGAAASLLDPFIANQADVSFEWYFKPEALVSLAVFYKDVDTHIGYTTDALTLEGVTYALTGPHNGEGGGITGAEFTFQTPFSGVFKDFGIYMNYAYVDTDVTEFYPSTNPLPIEGYAQDTAAEPAAEASATLSFPAFELFRLVPGQTEAFIRSVAIWDQVNAAGGQPKTQVYLHEDGEGWDVMLFKPPRAKPTSSSA